MNNRIKIISVFPSLFFILFFCNTATGQLNNGSKVNMADDSLSLRKIIEQVVSSHPIVKNAEEALNNADARIELAKTGYYPQAYMVANFSNMGPVIKLSIPNMGTFMLYPDNNYSAAVNIEQTVYDFGRTKESILLENKGKDLGLQAVEQVKQKLSILTVNNFYSMVYIQAAIKIKDEQLAALNEHLEYVEKMLSTGSATEYQVLTTKVKISGVESQKVDLQAALKAQQASLNSLLGNSQDISPVVKNELQVEVPLMKQDSLLPYAFRNRDEVLLNNKRKSLAELKYDMVKLQNKPMLNLIASGGAKNGFIPNLYEIRPNYVIGLGFRVPIFDGMKNKFNLQQANSAITSIGYESESTKRNVSNEIIEAEVYVESAHKKIKQSELQLMQALKAYSLAETSFKSGVITNLDMLDAGTAVSETRLMLLKSRIDYATSIYRLNAALGNRLY